jgi:hypothetical protein
MFWIDLVNFLSKQFNCNKANVFSIFCICVSQTKIGQLCLNSIKLSQLFQQCFDQTIANLFVKNIKTIERKYGRVQRLSQFFVKTIEWQQRPFLVFSVFV